MSHASSKEYFHDDGTLGEFYADYSVRGKAYNGDLVSIEPGIISVGQDCILYKPELGLFGVFDGAGGAAEVGDPSVASTIAAQAVAEYFKTSTLGPAYDLDHMQGAMDFARKRVAESKNAGLTTALFFMIKQVADVTYIDYAVAGDSTLSIYPDSGYDGTRINCMDWLGPDQSDVYGDPTNVLGAVPKRIQLSDDDFFGTAVVNRSRDRYVVLATDGITGNFRLDDGIDEADIEFAFESTSNLKKTADLLIEPPIKRIMRRKVDDKSLVVVRVHASYI